MRKILWKIYDTKLNKIIQIALIKLCSNILMGMNFPRSRFVSRRDNNDMWYTAEKLDGICKRMKQDYED